MKRERERWERQSAGERDRQKQMREMGEGRHSIHNAHKCKQTHRWCWRQEPGLLSVCVSQRSVNSYLELWLRRQLGPWCSQAIEVAWRNPLIPIACHPKVGNHHGQGRVVFCEHLENSLGSLIFLVMDRHATSEKKGFPDLCLYKLPHFSLRPRSHRSCDRKKANKTIRCLQTWVLLGSEMPRWQDKNKRINRSKIHGTPWHTVLCLNLTVMLPPSSMFPAPPCQTG